MKRLISLVLTVCMVCCLFGACAAKPDITSQEAYQVVLDMLGDKAETAKNPHIHSGEYRSIPCYNIYVTVDGVSMVYIVSKTGDILHSAQESHRH